MWGPHVFNLSPLFLCSPNSLDGTLLSYLSLFNFSLLIFFSTNQPLKVGYGSYPSPNSFLLPPFH